MFVEKCVLCTTINNVVFYLRNIQNIDIHEISLSGIGHLDIAVVSSNVLAIFKFTLGS